MDAPLPQTRRRQLSGTEGTGVDIEPKPMRLGLSHRRMAMNDQLRQRLRAVVKARADENEVVVLLCRDRPFGIDTGMDEQHLRRIQQDRQPAEKVEMIVG